MSPPEIIDLTASPEVITVDFDSPLPAGRAAKNQKQDSPLKATIPSNGINGTPTALQDSNKLDDTGLSNGVNGKTKKRRKKKRKVPVGFMEDGEVEDEFREDFTFEVVEDGEVAADEESGVGVGEVPSSSSSSRSLLDRLGLLAPNGGPGDNKTSPRKKRQKSKERDRERERETVRDREKERDRERVREDGRERERERDRDKDRDRPRERDRDRDHYRDRDRERRRDRSPPPSRRRSRSPERRRRGREDRTPEPTSSKPTTNADLPLFYVDTDLVEMPISSRPSIIVKPDPSKEDAEKERNDPPQLLLPLHVTIVGDDDIAPVEILPPAPLDSESEDYIEYLDYDDDRRVRK